MLNTTTPLTNDIIGPSFTTTAADGDSVSYDYVWRVNGNVIRTTTTNLPYDPYHLYYGGYGDKGQTVEFSVTPWDANDRGVTVTVSAIVVNSPPLIDTGWLWAIESFKGDAASLQLSASDPDGDEPVFNLLTSLPPGLSMSSTALITGTVLPSANTTTPYAITVTATDGEFTDTTTFNWTIKQPVITLDNPGNQSYDHNTLVSLWLTASNNASHPLTYSIASATPLPDGLSLDAPYPDFISGTIPITAVSATPYTVTVIATDILGGASESQTFTITVVNHAPTIGNLNFGDPNPKTNDVLNVYVNSPADINGDAISYTYVWTVNGFVVQTTTTTSTTDPLDLSQPGFGDKGQVIAVTVTASDSLDTGASFVVTATVGSIAPSITFIPPSGYVTNPDLADGPEESPYTEITFRIDGLAANGAIPTGTVTFTAIDPFNGVSTLGVATVGIDGKATLQVLKTQLDHTGLLIQADYSGDDYFTATSSNDGNGSVNEDGVPDPPVIDNPAEIPADASNLTVVVICSTGADRQAYRHQARTRYGAGAYP